MKMHWLLDLGLEAPAPRDGFEMGDRPSRLRGFSRSPSVIVGASGSSLCSPPSPGAGEAGPPAAVSSGTPGICCGFCS